MRSRPLGRRNRTSTSQRRHSSEKPPNGISPEFDANHEIGNDLHGNAKIWSMYAGEATEHDNAMLKGWNATLDVLLILAGLFSAVLTAFLMNSMQLLKPNPQDNVTALLSQVVDRLDHIVQTNNSVSPTTGNVSHPPQIFNPQPYAWWLNLLWFSSLVCDLSAAFIAVAVKQWLQAYNLDRPQRMDMLARQRHFRYTGLLKWKVSGIIAVLPAILQLGFGLFFGGLDILLWSTNRSIAYIMISLTGLLFCFHLVTTVAPLFDSACPFKTPFSLTLRFQIRRALYLGHVFLEYVHGMLAAAKVRFRDGIPSLQRGLDVVPLSNVEMEQVAMDRSHHTINLGIVEWLIVTSHNREVVDMSLKAIASLRPDFNATPRLRDSGAIHLLADRLYPPQVPETGSVTVAFRDHAEDSIPYLASMLCSLRHCTANDITHIPKNFHWRAWVVSWGDFTLEQLIIDGWNLEALALYLCASTQCDRAQGRRANREFGVMLELLDRQSRGDVKMCSFAVWALIDSIALWGAEFGEASMQSTRPAVVACLLRLLALPYTMGDPITCAIGVAIGVFALDFRRDDIAEYRAEEKRRQDAHVLLFRGVVDILKERPGSHLRYALNKDDFETGGMVICNLLNENNVPSVSTGASVVLEAMLESSTSETLTCRVLETFRRLLSFDSLSTVPNLSSAIIPLLENPTEQSVQVKATQVLGELVHWRDHRGIILGQGGVRSLIRNLTSSSEDLSNASSLALINLARDTHARPVMVGLGLAEALATFFGSSSASRQNLVYWSWTFVGTSWTEVWEHSTTGSEFGTAFRELAQVLEASMGCEGSDKDFGSTPSRRRDIQRILQKLKQLSGRWEGGSEETLAEVVLDGEELQRKSDS